MRAIDTIVWGLVVIVWVGLGSFAGVMALTIHGIAALGKLFSEEIEHIDPGPVEAVTATGANLIQTIRYAVIPQIIPSFLSYSLLRWDINMRSATVIGFVAGGGIGFFVIETVRMGGYQQYATALWAVAIVIIIVDYVSERWRSSILQDQPKADTRGMRPALRTLRTDLLRDPGRGRLRLLLGNHGAEHPRPAEPRQELRPIDPGLHQDRPVPGDLQGRVPADAGDDLPGDAGDDAGRAGGLPVQLPGGQEPDGSQPPAWSGCTAPRGRRSTSCARSRPCCTW